MDTYSTITNPMDKERVNDLLLTEKHLTDTYNTFANESSSKGLQQDLVSILDEEHEIEFKLFQEMQKRGWYTVENANIDDIDKVRKSYSKMT